MTEWQLRELMCEIGRRVWQRGFIAATDGNFSCRLDDQRVLATPTMMSKGFLAPGDLVIVDLEGRKISGAREVTSELKMHLNVFRRRPDIRACVHAHPPHATAFAIVQAPVPKCVMPEAEVFLGEVPIVPYATPGTAEFATVLEPHLSDFNVFLLANHGVLAIGGDLVEAYQRMETVDHYCHILLNMRMIGPPTEIPQEAMADLLEIKKRLGLPDRRLRPGADASCAVPSPTPRDIAGGASSAPSNPDIEKIVEAVLAAIAARRQ
jgi:L-fuculose-phosphate aldolase